MTDQGKADVDVLVVGAGPTGLTAAIELLRHGATVRIVDQLPAPVTTSKAAVVHARTMEHLDAMGVAEAIAAKARVVRATNVFAGGKRVAHIGMDDNIDSPYPHAYGISQHDTEAVLTAHLATLGCDVLRRGDRDVRLESFTQDDGGVTSRLAGNGVIEIVRSRWLIGADGAHSTVRKGLGFAFEGAPYEERLIQADLRVHFAARVEDDEALVFLHERGPAILFPLFNDGRYRLILFDVAGGHPDADADAGPVADPTLEDFQRGLELRGVDARVSDPAWTIAFRIHHRHVERLRDRHVFLAGDAAHIHSPVGGQGMNTGMQDAVNLAWKLGLAAKGKARASLLDAYEAERLPVIRALVSTTDRAMHALTAAIKLRAPLAVGLRDQLLGFVTRLGAVQSQATNTITMLGIGYPASPICGQDRPALWQASLVNRVESESPSVLDWAAFGSGPAPGSRAPDATAHGGTGAGPVRVHELLRAGKHVALLFDGAAATEAGYANLTGIARRLHGLSAGAIEAFLVVPAKTAPPSAQWEGATLLDGEGDVHRRYGARSECVYVIRPDGYVGFRGQPADSDKLAAWFATWLA